MAKKTRFRDTGNPFASVQSPAERKWSNANVRKAARKSKGKGSGKGGGS